jgi:hypothetical protein
MKTFIASIRSTSLHARFDFNTTSAIVRAETAGTGVPADAAHKATRQATGQARLPYCLQIGGTTPSFSTKSTCAS